MCGPTATSPAPTHNGRVRRFSSSRVVSKELVKIDGASFLFGEAEKGGHSHLATECLGTENGVQQNQHKGDELHLSMPGTRHHRARHGVSLVQRLPLQKWRRLGCEIAGRMKSRARRRLRRHPIPDHGSKGRRSGTFQHVHKNPSSQSPVILPLSLTQIASPSREPFPATAGGASGEAGPEGGGRSRIQLGKERVEAAAANRTG